MIELENIREALGRVEANQQTMMLNQTEALGLVKEHARRIGNLEATTYGDGSAGSPGLKLEVFALKRAIDSATKESPWIPLVREAVKTIIVAAVVAVAAFGLYLWKIHS